MNVTLTPHDLHLLLHAEHMDPFAVLGLQSVGGVLVVRAFRPDAKALSVVDRTNPKTRFPAEKVSNEGVFEARLNGRTEAFDYLLEITSWAGETSQVADPYSFWPLLGNLDMHLFCEGTHY